VHRRKHARRQLSEPADSVPGAWVKAGKPEQVLGGDSRPDHIAARYSGRVADLGEQITTEQRAGVLFVQHSCFPAVGTCGVST
jgi:hypothetical protein